MLARILIDSAEVPGGGTLRLIRRGDEFSIMLGANELMNSRLSGSEEALAQLSLARVAHLEAPRVLIGGLGMGFTLRAALDVLGPEARVTVAELIGTVVDWAHGPMADLFGASLADRRVDTRVADVADLITARRDEYDAILLDVDNGPDGLTQVSNDRLYSGGGLVEARTALRPGGVLAIWSSAPDEAFTRRLTKAGFEVEVKMVRARATRKGAHHVIWLAKRPGR
jgi:spermidine synthase